MITGARRIGAVVATGLAARGAHVALSYYRSRDEAERCAAAIRVTGRRAAAIQADLQKPAECRQLVTRAHQELERLDVLINMASVYQAKPLEELTEEDWDRALGADLKAAFICAQAAIPHMRAAGGGRIINFSDWLASSGRPRYKGYLTYYVAKTGVIGLTEALALELAPDQILVNAVAPGPILAPEEFSEEQRQAVADVTPLGRWGGAAEVLKAVVGLIETDFITGEVVRVDGGRHVR